MILGCSLGPLDILVLNEDVSLYSLFLSVSWSNLIITSTLVKSHLYISLIIIFYFTKECRIIMIFVYLTLSVLDYLLLFFILNNRLSLTDVLGPRSWLDQEALFAGIINLGFIVTHLTFMLWSQFFWNFDYGITSQPNLRILSLVVFDQLLVFPVLRVDFVIYSVLASTALTWVMRLSSVLILIVRFEALTLFRNGIMSNRFRPIVFTFVNDILHIGAN